MNSPSVKARLKSQEGSTAYMYKCTGGEVTIGVGHALADAAAACKLKWTVNGGPASAARVQADYAKVLAAPTGAAASVYSPLTVCRIADADVEALLDADLQRFEEALRQAIPNWDIMPPPAQEALFDMGFNLGIGGLQKFKRLLAAVAARNWTDAALECHRKGIADSRNEETARLFRQAGAQGVAAT